MSASWSTIVTAAGRGTRLGADKALVDLGGRPAIAGIVAAHRRAGARDVLVVRRPDSAPLPSDLDVRVVVTEPPEMIDSIRAGIDALDGGEWACVHPVDYPLAGDGVLHALRGRCEVTDRAIVLPICGQRPGHPIVLGSSVWPEVLTADTLRDVIRHDPARVDGVEVDDPWVHRDVDEPSDLESARAWLARPRGPLTAVQRAHRSRRSYRDVPVPHKQLAWIVDSARHAATSSMMQAYAVVAVRDAARRAEVAALCSGQRHIVEAPVFLAICADLHRIERACVRHGGMLQGDSLEIFLQATIDAAILGQNIQLAAESEGLGSCWIGAARNHPVELANLLALPEHVYVVAGMTIGFAADEPIARGRMPLGAILFDERYDAARIDADLDAADEVMRAWARRTNAERGGYAGRPVDEAKGWADRMARLWGRSAPPKGRADLGAALRRLGFGLRVDRRDGEP